jgi:hypothetical protein
MKNNLTVAILVVRNANEVVVAPMVHGVCFWEEYGVRRSVVYRLLFSINMASVSVKMFSILIYLLNKFYKCFSTSLFLKIII